MGISYHGPYADDVNDDAFHEGYAARLWPDDTVTGSWGGEHDVTGHIGLVGACECGWRSRTVHLAGDYGGPQHQAAERDFETEHLDPLIEAAKQRSWPRWARRVAARAAEIAGHVHAGRLDDANDILDSLRDDVGHRTTILADLVLDRDTARHRDCAKSAPVRPFVPLRDDQPPLPPTAAGAPVSGATLRHPPTR